MVIKLVVDLGHLLKDPRKWHEKETTDESIMGQNSSQSSNHRRLKDSQAGLLPTCLGKPLINNYPLNGKALNEDDNIYQDEAFGAAMSINGD